MGEVLWIPHFHLDSLPVTATIRERRGRPKYLALCGFRAYGADRRRDGTEREACSGVVQLIVEFAASPGQLEDVLTALQAVMRPARLDRRCASASIWCDPEDACALMYVEEWLDAAQFALEVRGERMGRLLELVESATRAPTIEVRSIESVRGLDYLAAIRLGHRDEETPVPLPDA